MLNIPNFEKPAVSVSQLNVSHYTGCVFKTQFQIGPRCAEGHNSGGEGSKQYDRNGLLHNKGQVV
jgi:hypothetical protein